MEEDCKKILFWEPGYNLISKYIWTENSFTERIFFHRSKCPMLAFPPHAFKLHLEKVPLPKSLYDRRNTCLVLSLSLYTSRHIASSPLNQMCITHFLSTCWHPGSKVSSWAGRDQDSISPQEPDSMEWQEGHTMNYARRQMKQEDLWSTLVSCGWAKVFQRRWLQAKIEVLWTLQKQKQPGQSVGNDTCKDWYFIACGQCGGFN